MTDREKRIIDRFNILSSGQNMKIPKSEYARFDCYRDGEIMEVKERFEPYDPVMIEFDKYAFNSIYAKIHGYKFLYLVFNKPWFHLFDMSRLDESGYNYKWEWKLMPRATDFGSSVNVNKFIGYIDLSEAKSYEDKDWKE